jgi:hypothetical protein
VVSCVPVKGGEDVLILCLNPAPLSTQDSVSLQCVICAGCLVTGLFNCWPFSSIHTLCFLLDPLGFLRKGGGGWKSYLLNSWAGLNFKTPSFFFNYFALMLFLKACRCESVLYSCIGVLIC